MEIDRSQYNGNKTGKKNVPKVWPTPSFKALKNVNLLTSSKSLDNQKIVGVTIYQ